MADLDEALFSIDGVRNFTASLCRKGETDRLEVEIWGAGETKVPIVQQAIEAIPGVRAARDAGHLDVVSMVQKERPFDLSGPAKRIIADRRTGSA